ncbi:MAG TPA: thiopeptide-type bacteriocin biosynthesis protein, partial [Hymenobacter sp.]
RSYEIPFLSPAAVSDKNQIFPDDLLVSVRQGHVTLRSKRLNKQVIPRLSTAHNSNGGLPLYRFLCDMQRVNSRSTLTWNWEKLSQQPFLPRIQYKHIILAKAKWFIRYKDLSVDQAVKPNDAQLRLYLTSHALPRYFCLTEYDNELVLDSEQAIDRQIMLQHLGKEGQLKLTEFLSTVNQCFLREANHCYANEVLLPLRNSKARQPADHALSVSEWPTRSFSPGSEWVYLKLYGGTKYSDQVLTDVLLPLIMQWRQRGLIQQWFYIRYADPQYHLRVRFRLAAKQADYLGMLLSEVHTVLTPLLTQGRLHKIQLDTYERELERYGPANIENSEALFSHDSLATASILALLGGDEGETYRWLLALRGLDELLNDFGLELLKKQQFLQYLSQVFFQEFKGDKALTVQLDKKYRHESLRIHRFLDPKQDASQGIEEAAQYFVQRSQNWQPIIVSIQAQYPNGLLETDKGRNLLFSYVHMYLNRFILSQPRVHELTLYALLYKYYTAQLAKGKAASMAGQVED